MMVQSITLPDGRTFALFDWVEQDLIIDVGAGDPYSAVFGVAQERIVTGLHALPESASLRVDEAVLPWDTVELAVSEKCELLTRVLRWAPSVPSEMPRKLARPIHIGGTETLRVATSAIAFKLVLYGFSKGFVR